MQYYFNLCLSAVPQFSCYNNKMRPQIDYRSPRWITGLACALLVASVLMWWKFVYLSPKRAFEDMLVNNLTTTNVTKNVLSGSNDEANLQRISMHLGAQNIIRSLATVRSSTGSATTETLATPNAGFVRYTSITDTQTKQNYSAVINRWATSAKGASDDVSKLFSQSLLDVNSAPVPPLGYVEAEKRDELLDYMRDEQVFTPDYSTVKQQVVNGRKVYVYDVSVKLAPYLRMMQEFSHVYGLKDLDAISPTDYQSATPIRIALSVDKVSHEMSRIAFASNGFNETYTDYGVAKHIELPTKTITTAELSNRLKALQ
jgi:hypothetical protein